MQIFGVVVDDMSIRQVNKVFRENDESHLWPVSGRFCATERAIRRLRRNVLPHIGATGGVEYAQMLDHEISLIVNNQV